jgi:glucan 1,3-beta-glucosidase
MRVIDVVSVLFGLSGTAVASPAVAVPKASSVVASVTASFAAAVLYTRPTGSASYSLKTSSTSKSIAPVATPETAAVGATPYWLELINHQGISAFNSNPSSYQVFRNVKDFGAKGWLHVSKKSTC